MHFGRTTSALALSALLTQPAKCEALRGQTTPAPTAPSATLSLDLSPLRTPAHQVASTNEPIVQSELPPTSEAPTATPATQPTPQRNLRAIKELPTDYAPPRTSLQKVGDFIGSTWSNFKDFISLTANIIQNIDGLVVLGASLYFLRKIYNSLVGFDETTIKASSTFDSRS